MRVLLDTGPLVALLNRRDAAHRWSVEEAAKLKPPFFSCEAVITEAHFLLRGVPLGRERLIELIALGRFDLSFSFWQHQGRVGELMEQYSNVPMSFADACLVAMAEESDGRIFTLDADFHIYRRHGQEALQLIIP